MSTDARDPFAGLRAQADALAAGAVTSRTLVEDALARIAQAQPHLAAFEIVRGDDALAEADAADARLAAGERAPLLGVPVAVKDDTDVAGLPTAFGCRGAFAPCPRDAEAVRRLREAGAVVVGKTATSQLGQWPFGASPTGTYTRNPWSLAHTPGGSSAGSAAAVAAGLVPAAVGSDGAGSVRIPAAWTGLVGLKPQRGRISTFPDREAFQGLTCFGPLARTVDDAALLLDVLAGPHPEDLHTPPAPEAPFAELARRDPGRLRIGLSWSIPFSGPPARMHPENRAAVERIAGVLAGLGHEIVDASPFYGLVGLSFVPRSLTGVREWVRRVPDTAALDPRTRENARTGRLLEGPALRAARAAEPLLHRQLGAVFQKVDVVLTPTTATPPVAFDRFHGLSNWQTDKAMIAACPMAWPWNVVGWPGLSVPAGLTADGLPVGAMLLGQACDEGRLLALGRELEAAERWQDRRPPALAGEQAAA